MRLPAVLLVSRDLCEEEEMREGERDPTPNFDFGANEQVYDDDEVGDEKSCMKRAFSFPQNNEGEKYRVIPVIRSSPAKKNGRRHNHPKLFHQKIRELRRVARSEESSAH